MTLPSGQCLFEDSRVDGKFARRVTALEIGATTQPSNRLFQVRVRTTEGDLLFRVTCRTLPGQAGVDAMMSQFVKLPLLPAAAVQSPTNVVESTDVVVVGLTALLCGDSPENPCEIEGVEGTTEDPCPNEQYPPDDGWYHNSWDNRCDCTPSWPCDDGWGSGGTNDPPNDETDAEDTDGSGGSDPCSNDPASSECACYMDPTAPGCEEFAYECPASYHVSSSDPLTMRHHRYVEPELRFWYFDTWGTMHKVEDTPTGFGPPKAWYSIPQGPWFADPARSHGPGTLWSGETYVSCHYEVDEFGNIIREYFLSLQNERNMDYQVEDM